MNKRLMALAVVLSAGIMVASSAAYACTAFLGSFTVTPSHSGPVATTSGSSTAVGTDPCNPVQFNMTQNVTTNTATAQDATGVPAGQTQSVTISTAAANGCKLPATMASGTAPRHYDINFYNSNGVLSPGYVGNAWAADCMSPLQGGTGTKLGEVLMDSNGVAQPIPGGSLTFLLLPPPARQDSPGESSAVCISNPTGDYGNQAPITIV